MRNSRRYGIKFLQTMQSKGQARKHCHATYQLLFALKTFPIYYNKFQHNFSHENWTILNKLCKEAVALSDFLNFIYQA